MTSRADGRPETLARPLVIEPGYLKHAEGSVQIRVGDTHVICSASVEERVPPFLKGRGTGWVTAEYGMLPRSTETRMSREASRGKQSGRTQEIQRLIGRSLRAVVDLDRLGERTIWVDCDVIQADGGTRTASISGAYVALVLAMRTAKERGTLSAIPVFDQVAAVSVGIVDEVPMLDLDYKEDSNAEVDMNIVKTGRGRFVEVQGTAESKSFTEEELVEMLRLAGIGIDRVIEAQREILGDIP